MPVNYNLNVRYENVVKMNVFCITKCAWKYIYVCVCVCV